MSVDRTTKPCKIDIGLDDMGTGGQRYDSNRGRFHIYTMKGIFEIEKHPTDTTKDRLKWCFAMPGKERPVDFVVEPGSDHKLLELERFVLDEKEAKEKLLAAEAEFRVHYVENWVETLTLKNADGPNAPLEEVRKLRKLKTLNLDSANSKIVKSLSENIALMSVNFDCEVTPKVLHELSKAVPHLRMIELRCPSFTPEHGKAIAQFESLLSITITNNEADVSGLKELANGKVTAVLFRNCKLDESCLDCVATWFTNIGHLGITNCDIPDAALRPVARMQSLWRLILSNSPITDEGIRNLKSLPKLYNLNINGTSVTNASMEFILENFPELSFLQARDVDFDEGIIPMLAKVDRWMSISQSSVSRAQAKAAGEKVANILR